MSFLHIEIEKIKQDNASNYIDALIHFSEIHNVDIELLAEYIKTDNVLTGVSDLLSNLFKFIRYSLEKKQLKKIFFLLFMSLAMAILLMGVNLIFGKIVI